MIEPTEEMRSAIGRAAYGQLNDDERDAVAAAVLAIVERDRCMEAKGHVYHPLAKNRGEAD